MSPGRPMSVRRSRSRLVLGDAPLISPAAAICRHSLFTTGREGLTEWQESGTQKQRESPLRHPGNSMNCITTVKREFPSEIDAGRKRIEYRELKSFDEERRAADGCSGRAESAELS
jgi:hypothetical protein